MTEACKILLLPKASCLPWKQIAFEVSIVRTGLSPVEMCLLPRKWDYTRPALGCLVNHTDLRNFIRPDQVKSRVVVPACLYSCFNRQLHVQGANGVVL